MNIDMGGLGIADRGGDKRSLLLLPRMAIEKGIWLCEDALENAD